MEIVDSPFLYIKLIIGKQFEHRQYSTHYFALRLNKQASFIRLCLAAEAVF